MKTSRGALLAWLLVAPTLLGCSLMSLDDFRQQRCHSNDDCLPAQTAFGNAERCDFYVCRQGACVPQHGTGTETCDGEDDDCNGFIDDGVAVIPRELTGTSSSDAFVAYATSPSGAPTAYVVGGVRSDSEPTRQGTVVRGTDLEQSTSLVYASAAMAGPGQPCPGNTVSAGVGASVCWFDEVALGADQEQLVYATINTAGCSKGQLRVGLALASEPFRVWLGSSPAGTAARSNIEVGVDVGAGSCSGNSVRDETGAVAGARSPAVAVLDASPGGAGALVTWLAASYEVPLASCGEPADVPVQALAVMVPEEARDAVQSWLVGSNKGIPIEIGRSSSLRPPAVVGLTAQGGTGGYLVAFPANKDGADGIALVFVTLTGGQVRSTEGTFIADDRPDLVALANSTSDGNVALAWRSGCGPTSELKVALLSASGNAIAAPLSLGIGNIVSSPQLLHASDGFTTQGKRGGWYVSWSESLEHGVGRTRLARLADEASPIAPEVFTVTSGALGFPLLFPGEDSKANHGLTTMMGAEPPVIRVFPNWCD